jgi:hypothetical protein
VPRGALRVLPHIEQIISISDDGLSDPLYFMKWSNKSFIHCSHFRALPFLRPAAVNPRSPHSKGPHPNFNQARLTRNGFCRPLVNFVGGRYLVKWKHLPYDQASWEIEGYVPDRGAIAQLFQRRSRSNSIANALELIAIFRHKRSDEIRVWPNKPCQEFTKISQFRGRPLLHRTTASSTTAPTSSFQESPAFQFVTDDR